MGFRAGEARVALMVGCAEPGTLPRGPQIFSVSLFVTRC
jgi:hypothetical protein